MDKTLIFDAHLDLAMNAIEWNRDLTRSLTEIRERNRLFTGVTKRKSRLSSSHPALTMQSAWEYLSGMEFSSTGLGNDPGTTFLV
jgi:hypothetical protein